MECRRGLAMRILSVRRWSEITDCQSIFARSASVPLFGKKVKLTLIGSRPCAKMIGGGRPLLHENLADTDPLLCKMLIYFRP